jgi:hypothetical protein
MGGTFEKGAEKIKGQKMNVNVNVFTNKLG